MATDIPGNGVNYKIMHEAIDTAIAKHEEGNKGALKRIEGSVKELVTEKTCSARHRPLEGLSGKVDELTKKLWFMAGVIGVLQTIAISLVIFYSTKGG